MFRYGHRLSKDIDIFVPDPQYLGYVTPRLSDTAASLTEEYTRCRARSSSCSSRKARSTSWPPGFVATFEALAATAYRPSLAHCIEVATPYLFDLKDR